MVVLARVLRRQRVCKAFMKREGEQQARQPWWENTHMWPGCGSRVRASFWLPRTALRAAVTCLHHKTWHTGPTGAAGVQPQLRHHCIVMSESTHTAARQMGSRAVLAAGQAAQILFCDCWPTRKQLEFVQLPAQRGDRDAVQVRRVGALAQPLPPLHDGYLAWAGTRTRTRDPRRSIN